MVKDWVHRYRQGDTRFYTYTFDECLYTERFLRSFSDFRDCWEKQHEVFILKGIYSPDAKTKLRRHPVFGYCVDCEYFHFLGNRK